MRKMYLRFGAALLAIIMCFGLLVGCGKSGITLKSVQKDPYAAIVAGGEKYIDALEAKYDKVFAVLNKVAEGVGTYALKLSVPDMGDVDVSAVVDAANAAYSAKAAVGADGFTTAVSLWGDKNNIALSAPALLGDNTYGVKFDTFEDDLAESELLKSLTGGMSLEEIKGALESEAGIKWDDFKSMLSADKLTEAMNKYTSDMEAFMKGKTYTVAEETFKIGETDVPVISVSYSFTAEEYDKIIDIYVGMIDSVLGGLLKASGVDIREEMENMMSDEGVADLMGDAVSVKTYLNKKTGAVVAETTENEALKATVVFGEDVSKKLDMSVDMTLTQNDESVSISAVIAETASEGKSGFNIDVTVKANDDEYVAGIDILRDDADGKFEATATVDGEEMGSIAGSLTFGSDEFVLGIDSVTVDGETTNVGLTVSVKAGGTVEAVPEYTNILTASEEDIGGILEALGSIGGSISDGMISGGFDSDTIPDGTYEEGPVAEGGDELTIEDLYGDMTDEEIEQFLKDLEDLGMTTDDIIDMLYS